MREQQREKIPKPQRMLVLFLGFAGLVINMESFKLTRSRRSSVNRKKRKKDRKSRKRKEKKKSPLKTKNRHYNTATMVRKMGRSTKKMKLNTKKQSTKEQRRNATTSMHFISFLNGSKRNGGICL